MGEPSGSSGGQLGGTDFYGKFMWVSHRTQPKNWNQIMEPGDSTWVWTTGVLSQNTAEYSFLTHARITDVPTSHKLAGTTDITIS